MERTEVLKVFYPQCLLNANSGICFGTADPVTKSICILTIVHPCKGQRITGQDNSMQQDYGMSICGTYKNTSRNASFSSDQNVGQDGFIIEMEQRHHNGIPACKVNKSPWQHSADAENTSLLFILFNEAQILNSCLDSDDEVEKYPLSDVSNGRSSSLVGEHRKSNSNQCEAMHFLSSTVQHFTRTSHALAASKDMPMSCIRTDTRNKGFLLLKQLFGLCFFLPVFLVRCFFYCLETVMKTRCFQNEGVHRVFTFPAIGSQLANKSHQFCEFMRKDNSNDGRAGSSQGNRNSKHHSIRIGNSFSTLLVDLLLGLVLLMWMYNANIPVLFADILKDWADRTGISLQHLLHWLMGAPAGLKLNTFLAQFLGNFFLYHVYLWIGYLSVLLPIMTTLLWCIAGAGVLGLSVQLALTSDLLSLLTFHIYCFYVYAARIYSLQVSGLLSLARLFQGKKWNVLRQRVDSCSYDVDQLFMGTLLFTMLFFMLPTTALFYVVFTMLRLLILVIQSLLSILRELLHSFPWFSLFLWLTGSDLLNQGIQFQVLPILPWQPTSLFLQMQLMTLGEALQVGRSLSVTLKPPKLSLLAMGSKLVRGHLIYPWGGEHS